MTSKRCGLEHLLLHLSSNRGCWHPVDVGHLVNREHQRQGAQIGCNMAMSPSFAYLLEQIGACALLPGLDRVKLRAERKAFFDSLKWRDIDKRRDAPLILKMHFAITSRRRYWDGPLFLFCAWLPSVTISIPPFP